MGPKLTPEQMMKGEIPEGMRLIRKIDHFDEGGPTIVVYQKAKPTKEEVERTHKNMQRTLERVIREIAMRETEEARCGA